MSNNLLEAIEQNLPAIIVVLPLLIAPILAVFSAKSENSRYFAWLLCFATCGLVTAAAGFQLIQVEMYGAKAYDFGNWPSAVGIEHLADNFNAMLLLFVAAISFIILPYALMSIEREVKPARIPIFYASFLLCLSGLLGMLSTNDMFNFFVFLEVSSITGYAMVALGRDKKALLAAFNYLIIGSVGATFYVLGIMFLFAQTGSLNFGEVSQALAGFEANKLTIAAFAFIAVGLMIKAGVYPLASWLPSAYAEAPQFVSGWMSGTATKVALFAFIKVIFTLFGASLLFEQIGFDSVLLVLALAAMFYGSIAAIYQRDVKKLLAYSSIANVGYIVLGVALANQAGMISAIFNLVAHGVAKTGAFLALGVLVMAARGSRFEDLSGLGKKMPFTMLLFIIFGLSLIGVPLTAGFIAKWHLLAAAMSGGYAVLIVTSIMLSSLLAVVYVWRIVEVAYFGELSAKMKKKKDLSDPDSYYLAPLWLLAGALVYFGVNPSGLLNLARDVAGGLL